jgi:hypothetical protein
VSTSHGAILLLVLLAACAPDDQPEPLDAWEPGEALASDISAPRGQLDVRGIIHAHSVYSYDACDYEPVDDDGNVDEQCFDELRSGLCAVLHDFVMLSDHRDAFAHTPFPETLLYRPDRGDVLVERGGLPVANRAACPDGGAPLVLAGVEAGTMPVGLEHHVSDDPGAVYGSKEPADIAAMKEAGAVILAQHTEDWTVEQLVELPIDGFEMFNIHANLFDDPVAAINLLLRIEDSIYDLPHPDLIVGLVVHESPDYVDVWGTVLSRGARRVTTMGTDSHRNSIPEVLLDGERGDSFRRMMAWFSNHLLVEAEPDGSWDDRHLKEALRAGRLYGVFEFLGFAEGFDYVGRSGDTTFEMGAEAPVGATLSLQLPSVRGLDPNVDPPELTARILKAREGGWDEVASGAGSLEFVAEAAGAYRAEVRMRPRHLRAAFEPDAEYADADFVWIYGNPIYVQ